jgi:hypothetical protein
MISSARVRGPIPGLAANVFLTFRCAYLYSTRQAGARCTSAFRLADFVRILGLSSEVPVVFLGGFDPVTSSIMNR